MSLVHAVTVGLLALMMFFQIRNFVKFRKTNGANLLRILIFISTACMLVHSIKLSFGHTDGAFLLTSVAVYLSIYLKEE